MSCRIHTYHHVLGYHQDLVFQVDLGILLVQMVQALQVLLYLLVGQGILVIQGCQGFLRKKKEIIFIISFQSEF